MTYSNEVKAFADSRETSHEIAQAIFDLFPDNAAQVWAEPTDDQRAAVISAAWKLADSDADCLIWGCEKFHRDSRETDYESGKKDSVPVATLRGTTMDASNFRIEEIRKANVNGRAVKMFKAYERRGNTFVFCGQFSAPPRIANKELWKIAAEACDA